MNRKPVFLDYEFGGLHKKIDQGFKSKLGPGEYPVKPRSKMIKGVVAPNYDYDFSSPALAWVYKEIAESELADVYIIVGRCESGFNTYLFGDWDTPFGSMKVDGKFGRELIKKFPMLRNDSGPFMEDGSIERQLPFLHFAKKDFFEKIRFLPILVGDVSYEKLVEFADVLSNCGEKISIICSGNFSHYGREFGNVPFVHGIKENLHLLDKRLIDFVVNLDSKGFYENGKKILDRNVFVLGMETFRGLGSKKGSLLNYYTSGEIDGNYDKSVGMGALVFR